MLMYVRRLSLSLHKEIERERRYPRHLPQTVPSTVNDKTSEILTAQHT